LGNRTVSDIEKFCGLDVISLTIQKF